MKKFAIATVLASASLVTACAGNDYEDRRYYSRDYDRVYLERDVYYSSNTGIADYYFDSMDYDGNQRINFAEHQAFAEMSFDDADMNADGYLTREEVRAFSAETLGEWKPVYKKGYYKSSRSKAGTPNVMLPNRTNANPTEHSANPTNPSQEWR